MAILGSVEYSTGRKSANQYQPRPKHIQIPFQKFFPALIRLTHFFNQKNLIFGHFTKISIFGQVLFLLFLLLFGVPQCCFFKSMIFQLSFAQKIIIISFLDQKLCQFEIWSIPCYLVILMLSYMQMYVTMQNSGIFSIWGVPILRSTTYIFYSSYINCKK